MSDSIDAELNVLVSRITRVQDELCLSAAEKDKDNNPFRTLSGGSEEEGKVDRFIVLKDVVEERVHRLKEYVESLENYDRQGAGGGLANAKEVVSLQSKMRNELQILDGEFKEMEALHSMEGQKKRVSHMLF
jgi:hypothetical protein